MSKQSKGVLYILLSAFFFALTNIFVRLSGDLPYIQKALFRNIIAVLFAFIIVIKKGDSLHYKKNDIPFLLLRSTAGTIGILCNFYAIDHMLVADATMLNKLSPFFSVIFSIFLLKEKLKNYQIISLFVVFSGALFIIKPSFIGIDMIPGLIALIGGISAGLAYTSVRILGLRGIHGPKIVMFFSGFSCLCISPFALYIYTSMSLFQIFILICTGLSATMAQFAVTAAYANAPAREISVFDYSQILWVALLGFILFNQIPDLYSFFGYIIICSAAIIVFFLNKKNYKNE